MYLKDAHDGGMCLSSAPVVRYWWLLWAFEGPGEGTVVASGMQCMVVQVAHCTRTPGRGGKEGWNVAYFPLNKPCSLGLCPSRWKNPFFLIWYRCVREYGKIAAPLPLVVITIAALVGRRVSAWESPICPFKRVPSILFSFQASFQIFSSPLVGD